MQKPRTPNYGTKPQFTLRAAPGSGPIAAAAAASGGSVAFAASPGAGGGVLSTVAVPYTMDDDLVPHLDLQLSSEYVEDPK